MAEIVQVPVQINENQTVTTISLQELQRMEEEQKGQDDEQKSGIEYFDVYRLINSRVIQVALRALDTEKVPRLPIRRKECTRIQCMFEYEEWKGNKDRQIYSTCRCQMGNSHIKSDYKIDWRLAQLLQKVKSRRQECSYMLCWVAGCLWIMQQQKQEQRVVNCEIYWQDCFGLVSCWEFSQLQCQKVSIRESNRRYFLNMLKIHMQRYLLKKNDWETSNLEEECQQIVDKFIAFPPIQKIKMNFQGSTTFNQYANMPSLKYSAKYHDNHTTQKRMLNSENRYEGCSNLINENIMFYYCSWSGLIFIRNAQFHPNEQAASNIRAVSIISEDDRAVEHQSRNTVWFKDRKGDVFSVHEGFLHIYKYHLTFKCYKKFQLLQDKQLHYITSSSSLLYIPQRDALYYFHPQDYKQSLLFELYRPKAKEEKAEKKSGLNLTKNSCISINLRGALFENIEDIRKSSSCKATYMIENYQFQQKKNVTRQEQIPVIYLLVEREKNTPIRLGLYKFIHHPEQTKIYELNSEGAPIITRDSTRDKIRHDCGIFGILKDGQQSTFYYQTLVNEMGVMYEGEVRERKVFWRQQLREITAKKQERLQKRREKNVLNYKIYNLPNDGLSEAVLNSPQTILINDFAGLNLNNEIRYLGCLAKQRKIVELSLNTLEGQPEWAIYHFL